MSFYKPVYSALLLLTALLLMPAGGLHANDFLRGENDVWVMMQVVDGETLQPNNHYSGGIYGYREFEQDNIDIYARAGFMLLAQFDDNSENDYFGVDGSAGILYGDDIATFAGGGFLFGETDTCTKKQVEDENCREGTVFGFFPEIGIRFKPTENTLIGLFVRKYSSNKEIVNFIGKGISLGLRF